MNAQDEVKQYLTRLQATIDEVALYLGVSTRTVRRWLDGEEVPGPALQALRAWLRLHDRHLPWRPDSESILDDPRQGVLNREHAIALDAVLERVEKRGGPRVQWQVDLARSRATLGPVEVTFYRLPNGSFTPSGYTRKDGYPDLERDRELIDDAVYCIAHALKRNSPDFGPVVLVLHDGRAKGRGTTQETRKFARREDAIRRGCEEIDREPFVTTVSPSEVLLTTQDLRRERVRRQEAPNTLKAMADSIRKTCQFFVREGATVLHPAETARIQSRIKAVAGKIDDLADAACKGSSDYQQFDALLGELHTLGFYPDSRLVAAVARALV